MSVATTPRVLWVELTSKCPFDCIFCSRKLRRGAGQHLPWILFDQLIQYIQDPRRIVLNYSGESTVYPEILNAIDLARSRGAFVELVSALANVPDTLLRGLASSGLGRMTVSVHALDSDDYFSIYRHASAESLISKLRKFVEYCRETPRGPAVDIGFVAMRRNLNQIPQIGRLAAELGIPTIGVFPVMRRDEIDVSFAELIDKTHPSEDFRRALREAVECAAIEYPAVGFSYSNPSIELDPFRLGKVPMPYPWPLPEDGRVHSCEQNPFETTHVLSNGDVVACEVLDRIPLGNLNDQTILQIWQGENYRQFRSRYTNGEVPECRNCVWKLACRPSPLETAILAERGANSQLLRGWHDGEPESGIVWSSQQAAAIVRARHGSDSLHVSGILPPPPDGDILDANELNVVVDGKPVGTVRNASQTNHAFGLDFKVPSQAAETLLVEFRTRYLYRSRDRGTGSDQRDLGFALVLLSSNRRPLSISPAWRGRVANARLLLERADRFGASMPPLKPRPLPEWKPGIAVLIPERDNPGELSVCLSSLHRSIAVVADEECEIVVVVNGTPASEYADLRRQHASVRWIFESRPLGFNGAIQRGLRDLRSDWVYLLNSDAELHPETLAHAGRLRAEDVFAVASQIHLKDPTWYRDETNLSALRVEDRLVTLHDHIPELAAGPVETSYAGGGASLFRTEALRRFVRESKRYSPFYWEDAEWGWRARKLGLRCLFCPDSVAMHARRSTIEKCYAASEVDEILDRNRLMFQLRNLLSPDLTERALEEVPRLRDDHANALLSNSSLWAIARQRIWNRRAPVVEEDLLAIGG